MEKYHLLWVATAVDQGLQELGDGVQDVRGRGRGGRGGGGRGEGEGRGEGRGHQSLGACAWGIGKEHQVMGLGKNNRYSYLSLSTTHN